MMPSILHAESARSNSPANGAQGRAGHLAGFKLSGILDAGSATKEAAGKIILSRSPAMHVIKRIVCVGHEARVLK